VLKDDDGMEEKEITATFLITDAVQSLFSPKPIRKPPTNVVYQDRPTSSMINYLLSAVIFTSLALFMGFGNSWMNYMGFLIGGFAPPLLYLGWMMRSDRFEREPLILIIYIVGWGAFSTIIASILNVFLTVPIFGAPGAAFVEEPLKIFGVYLLAKNTRIGRELNDHLDGMVYGAAAGAGFAGIENLYYIIEMVTTGRIPPIAAIGIRSATAFGHIAWSAMAGRSIGLAKALRGHLSRFDCIPALIVPVSLHFMWNYLSPILSLGIILPFTYISLIRQVRQAVEDEKRWGFQHRAPTES
jgi:RsiW-degrading membrane proteinase PrsW (M82 family)